VPGSPLGLLVPGRPGRRPAAGGAPGAAGRPFVRGARGVPLLRGQGHEGQRGGGVLAHGGPDQPAAPVDVSPAGRTAPRATRAEVPPGARGGGIGTEAARGDRVPALLPTGGT